MSSSKNTIKEVAQLAGVSIATVSRYLNNPASLKNKNRVKVEKAIVQLDYQPLIYARKLAGGKLNIFGLIIPGYEGIFYSFYSLGIIRGVASRLDSEGIDLHLHIFWKKDNFKSSLVDGVIFADIIGNEKQHQRLASQMPTVVINKKLEEQSLNFVAVNNFSGAYEATEFLINHGHKRIVHLAGDLRVQCAQERLAGFKHALEKNGHSLREDYIKLTHFSPKEARDRLEELFSLKERPTAIFCCSDEVAREVLTFAEEKRINIPKQLSVIGFDDNPFLTYGSMMLTTVRQPLTKMASLGVEILKEMTRKSLPAKRIILEPELIVRDTVGFL